MNYLNINIMFNKSVERRILKKFGINHVITAKVLAKMLSCTEDKVRKEKLFQKGIMFVTR